MRNSLSRPRSAVDDDELTSVIDRENGTIDMQKLTMLIWRSRDHPEFVNLITEFLSKHADEKTVFDGIEFYLPQIAHMIIHTEVDWPTAALEKMALIVCQQSLHFALQLHFILVASMEDYQPRFKDGRLNPDANSVFFLRCTTLLQNVERCIIFGSPRRNELQELFQSGRLTKTELEDLEIADRRKCATEIIESTTSIEREGVIWYTRGFRKFMHRTWKCRFFRVQQKMLLGLNTTNFALRVAIPLHGSEIKYVKDSKIPFYLEITCKNGSIHGLRFDTLEELNGWMEFLENTAIELPVRRDSQQNISPEQHARYDFFNAQKDFINNLINVAEELRFEEPEARQSLLKDKLDRVPLPETVYLPLCKSTDHWETILCIASSDGKVFSTRARCPTLILFEVAREKWLDVANYLYQSFESITEVPFSELMHDYHEHDDLHPHEEAKNETKKVRRNFSRSSISLKNIAGHLHLPGHRKTTRPSIWRISRPQPFHFENFRWQIDHTPLSGQRKLRSSLSRFEELAQEPPIEFGELEIVLEAVNSGIAPPQIDQITKRRVEKTIEHETSPFPQQVVEEVRRRGRKITCYGESFAEKRERIRLHSPAAVETGWDIKAIIVKSNDDLRQEVFVMQLIQFYQGIFKKEKVPVWIFSYRILSVSKYTGMLELIQDAISLDALKKKPTFPGTLRLYFEQIYGPPDSETFRYAQRAFLQSLAGYSVLSYLLAIKDRHNGNIMIDGEGHLIHIDFGFVFGIAPGNDFSFERAPFKLTREMVDVLGGRDSVLYREFIDLCFAALKVARKYVAVASTLIEIMMFRSKFPCFQHATNSLTEFRNRQFLNCTENELYQRTEQLVRQSCDHKGTNIYDTFQVHSNGIAK